MNDTALAKVERRDSYVVGIDDAISPTRLIEQVTLIQNVMKSVMKDKEHYGLIPGCGDKPSLLKPGAEKLCFTFRMDPEFEIEVIEMGRAHREYRAKCTLYSINGGARIGSGVGSACTMESKWRFRTGPKELTDKLVPKEYWDNRKTDFKKALEAIGGKGHLVAKGDDGKWYIAVQGEKVENDNPADVYNTVLKMAKKRAMVDAVLTCTAASDIFTQDVEELAENGVISTTATIVSEKSPQNIPPPEVPPPASAGVGDAAPAPAAPVVLPEMSIDQMRHAIDFMAQTAMDLESYPSTVAAIRKWSSTDKFQSKATAAASFKHDWQMKNVLKAAIAEGYVLPALVATEREPGADEDQDIPF